MDYYTSQQEDAKMVERESGWTDRGIKETIVIRKCPRKFNRDVGQ